QAGAHGGLRRGGVPVRQGGGHRRVADPRDVWRRREAPRRRPHVELHREAEARPGGAARAVPAARARVRRAEPLEVRRGARVGGASPRARVRDRVRPHHRQADQARVEVQALARRQGARGVHDRPAARVEAALRTSRPRFPTGVRASIAAGACGLLALVLSPAATAAPHFVKAGDFDSPVYVAGAPGDKSRLFVVEQSGVIRIIRSGKTLSTPFLDIRGRVTSGGEQGLLSMAFDPNYRSNKRFYVYYTNNRTDIEVDEFRASSDNRAKSSSRRKVIVIAHHTFANHNGGNLQFGPDKMLYLGTGDGGGGGDTLRNGQNKNALLGKLLRINPHRKGKKP